MQGVITSLKRAKTATVLVTRRWKHPLYKKYVKRSKKYTCHYADLKLATGDQVEIRPTRPISKTKRFIIVSKVAKQ